MPGPLNGGISEFSITVEAIRSRLSASKHIHKRCSYPTHLWSGPFEARIELIAAEYEFDQQHPVCLPVLERIVRLAEQRSVAKPPVSHCYCLPLDVNPLVPTHRTPVSVPNLTQHVSTLSSCEESTYQKRAKTSHNIGSFNYGVFSNGMHSLSILWGTLVISPGDYNPPGGISCRRCPFQLTA